jgi:hypothetical protein
MFGRYRGEANIVQTPPAYRYEAIDPLLPFAAQGFLHCTTLTWNPISSGGFDALTA